MQQSLPPNVQEQKLLSLSRLHMKPFSTWHDDEHPSPDKTLPSSQASSLTRTPSPHTARHTGPSRLYPCQHSQVAVPLLQTHRAFGEQETCPSMQASSVQEALPS